MRTILLSAIVLTLVAGCKRSTAPLPSRKLVGINDTAIYHFDREGRTALVEKFSISMTKGFDAEAYVYLLRDTLILGEQFKGYFTGGRLHRAERPFEIVIFKPSQHTLTMADNEKLDEYETLSYSFLTTEKGIFDFEGEIRYDTTVRPFHWKFIVK